MLGGWHPDETAPWYPLGVTTTNEVWSAPLSNLASWTRHLEHYEDPPTSGPGARWRRRHTFPWCVFNGAIWVLGGDLRDEYRTDVWRSTDPGNPNGWERIAATSPWGPNVYDPIVGVYQGRMHVMGGYRTVALRQHWSTADGANWTQHPDMPFARGGATRAVEIAGRLHILGGNSGTYATTNAVFPSDVWAWNGAKWRRMTSSAPWSGGMWSAACAYDGKLWMTTRGDYATGNLGGAYWSEDCGATWTNASSVAPWPISHADGFAVTEQHGIVFASGNNIGTNVYSLKRAA
jgi:hypothetical protein